MKDFIEFVNEHELGKIRENVSFKQLTSLKIGGTARCLYEPNSLDNLMIAYKYLKNRQIPTYAIGNGTNLLVSDDRFDLVLIKLPNATVSNRFRRKVYDEAAAKANRRTDNRETRLFGITFMGVIPAPLGIVI